MAITAMGLGTKAAPEGANLDPQRQFWSWLSTFIHPDEKSADSYHHQRGYFHGFACTQTDPAGMSIQIGGKGSVDSALLTIGGGRCVLLSTDGEPEVVTIPTAPASGSRIDAVVSYIDTTSADPEAETPGTPEYVHTIVVSGTAASSPSAPTDAQVVSALPAGAGGVYYRWCDVRLTANQTTITNSNITDRKPASPNVYSASILDLIYPVGSIAIGAKPNIGTWERIQGRFLWASNTAHPAGSTGGEETHTLTSNEMPSHSHAPFGGENNFYPVFPVSSAGNIRFSTALSYPAAGNSFKFLGTSDFSNTNVASGTRATRTNNTGGGRAHNNMPPYLSVDMWRRTA